jgi:hypothetical protein
MFLIALAMLAMTEAIGVASRRQALKPACRTIVIVAVIGFAAMLLGDSSFSNYAGYNGRNPNYNYGLTDGVLIWSGLAPKYMMPTPSGRHVILLPLLALCAFALWRVFSTLKSDGRYAGILLGYWGVMAAVYWRGDFFFFTKLLPPAMPLLLVAIPSVLPDKAAARGGKLMWWPRLVLAGALLWLGINGWRTLGQFYVPTSEGRQTYVDADISAARRRLVSSDRSVRVFAVDASPERHLLLRQLFQNDFWWPDRNEEIWGEFNIKDGNFPKQLHDGPFDLLVAAHDFRGAVDYRHLDARSYTGPLGPKVDVFGGGATIVEFDHTWVPGPWMKLGESREFRQGMRLTDTSSGVVTVRVQGSAPDLRIELNSPAANEVRLTLNGTPVGPAVHLAAGGAKVISVECSKVCRMGENTLLWEQSGNLLELANID